LSILVLQGLKASTFRFCQGQAARRFSNPRSSLSLNVRRSALRSCLSSRNLVSVAMTKAITRGLIMVAATTGPNHWRHQGSRAGGATEAYLAGWGHHSFCAL